MRVERQVAVAVAMAAVMLWTAPGQAEPIQLFEVEEGSEGSEGSEGPVIDRRGTESTGAGDGAIELEMVERQGTKMVELAVNGRQGYWMVDTGASFTTMSRQFARSVRATPPSNAPTVQMQTAGGVRSSQFGIIDRLEMDGHRLEGVSYTICDACAMGRVGDQQVVGLLGMNVLGRFGLQIDDEEGVVRLTPREGGQSRDMEPWLGVEAGNEPGEAVAVNRSPRRMRQLRVRLTCAVGEGDGFDGPDQSISSIRPGGSVPIEVHQGLVGCPMPKLEVVDGQW